MDSWSHYTSSIVYEAKFWLGEDMKKTIPICRCVSSGSSYGVRWQAFVCIVAQTHVVGDWRQLGDMAWWSAAASQGMTEIDSWFSSTFDFNLAYKNDLATLTR